MNRVYGTDGNVYETSISNGKEYTSSKKEKEEFAIAELEYLKANIRFQGYYNERIEDLIDKQIAVLKGENTQKSEPDDSNHSYIQTFDSFHDYWAEFINPNRKEK